MLIAYMELNTKSSLNPSVYFIFMFLYLANIITKGWKVLLTLFRYVHLEPVIYLDPKKYEPSRWEVFRYNRFVAHLTIKLSL